MSMNRLFVAFSLMLIPAPFAFAGAGAAGQVNLTCGDSKYEFLVPESPPPEFTTSVWITENGIRKNEKVTVTVANDLVSVQLFHPYCYIALQQTGPSVWERTRNCEGQALPTVACSYRWY